MMRRDLFRDERGFTTTSMALSLLITLALIFASAQVYRINTVSAEVQDVADAAALAAETQVGEFMLVARFCDAVVLSMSLTGIAACGLGIAALCTPPTATLSEGLISAGKKIIDSRNAFATKAQKTLNKLQEALPYFSAACAVGVAAANNDNSSGADYLGVALLVPSKGEKIEVDVGEKADELVEETEEDADEIKQKAAEAEEAAKEANEAKQKAFEHDCGNNPNYCMYERAAGLAGLSGDDNPLYESVDTWSFSVALERAKKYYANRSVNETADGSATSDLVRWEMRVKFYRYASAKLASEGYVAEADGAFDANFPHLPKNTDEMRATTLYTDRDYPVTSEPGDGEDETIPVMHAWSGCPGATGEVTAWESIQYMEDSSLTKCPVCEFAASTMGKVASASTSIDNGFEHHYAIVAEQAELYEEKRAAADGPANEVKEKAGSLLDQLKEALKEVVGKRIEVSPPGRYGAVAFVVNRGQVPAAGPFASGFSAATGSLGPHAAMSASTLLDEGTNEGRTIINSLLDNLKEDGGAAVGAAGIVLDAWSWMLGAYSKGIDSITGAIESGLNSIPLVGASGLGSWVSGKLNDALEGVGLQPAKISALKPVLVNSAHVAEKGEGRFASGLVSVKRVVVAHPLYSTDLFSALLTDAERHAIAEAESFPDTIEIASIELYGGGPSIPITIPLPVEVKEFGLRMIERVFDLLREFHAATTGVRAWE